MRLYVYVLEGKDFSVKDSFVKIQVGKCKSKTRIFKNSTNPVWNEESVFRVHDDMQDQDIVVCVFHHDEEFGSRDLMGSVRIPVCLVADEVNQTLPPTWFSLQRPKSGKFINKDCGKILLTISLHGKGQNAPTDQNVCVHSNINVEDSKESEGPCTLCLDKTRSKAPSRKKQLMKVVVGRFERLFNKIEETSVSDDSLDISSTLSDYEDCIQENPASCSFEEAIEMMQSKDVIKEMPQDLQGGTLLDQTYVVAPYDLSVFLFAPNSQFRKDLAELQGATDLSEGPWTWKAEDTSCLARVVSYTNAATKLVKAVRATEEQSYIKADGREFAVMVNVSTPEVPYGNTFKVELLYRIMPGPELSSGEETSHLVISWDINFFQSTMMKGMIERGAREGLKESFDQFSNLIAQNFKTLDSNGLLDKNLTLTTLQQEDQSDWKLAIQYFSNFTFLSAIILAIYVIVHIFLCEPSKLQSLEFYGLDLPDSFGELITAGILVLQFERVFKMISHFVQARLQRGSDHGVRAQGDGWMLTVALIEGSNLVSLDTTGLLDPYVVFACNGKTRTSSVKLQTPNPQWNEILEFDATEEPPSVLDVEVFDFDGPFDQATSLGHAEINFLRHTSEELADMWISLEGKLAQSSQSKLHLRIFLDNTNGVDTIKEYLTKMEKEVGKKLNLSSPHRNSAFQKLFGLPPEEFLIKDFTCSLKRKMPFQGRLFLSARIVGFYANFFGHKTKFFFLWEDIDDIHILPPSLSSVGSPTLVIVLRNGRGVDARHGAKSQDEEGRLRFYFQSFVSFNDASRTIMALWKSRTLTPDQKAEFSEDQWDEGERSGMLEETGSMVDVENLQLSKIYKAELPCYMKSLMEIFDGGQLEHRVMGKSGCLNYATTSWEHVKPDVLERQVSYKFNRHISVFGGEVTCTQQKYSMENDSGWVVDEIMALHNVPFSDRFRVHFRYQIEKSELAHNACKCEVYIGISWLKNTKFQRRITRNVIEKLTRRLEDIFDLLKREILLADQQDGYQII